MISIAEERYEAGIVQQLQLVSNMRTIKYQHYYLEAICTPKHISSKISEENPVTLNNIYGENCLSNRTTIQSFSRLHGTTFVSVATRKLAVRKQLDHNCNSLGKMECIDL